MRYHFLFLGSFLVYFSSFGQNLEVLQKCELDLTNDSKPDLATVVKTQLGQQLIVFVAGKDSYEPIPVTSKVDGMTLSCVRGDSLSETRTGNTMSRNVKTNGAYILLAQPEGAAVAYYWNNRKFSEIWTRD